MLSLLLLAALVYANYNLPEQLPPSWSPPSPVYPPKNLEPVPLKMDAGAYEFWFGKENTFAFQSFHLVSAFPFSLYVVDCFSPGDKFIVYNQGQFIDLGEPCQAASPNSQNYATDPETCYLDYVTWCGYRSVLEPGYYNFTMLMTASPQGYGAGFIAAYKFCPQNDLLCCELSTPGCNFGRAPDYHPPQRSNFIQ